MQKKRRKKYHTFSLYVEQWMTHKRKASSKHSLGSVTCVLFGLLSEIFEFYARRGINWTVSFLIIVIYAVCQGNARFIRKLMKDWHMWQLMKISSVLVKFILEICFIQIFPLRIFFSYWWKKIRQNILMFKENATLQTSNSRKLKILSVNQHNS